ncbi:glucokinase [Rhizorhapis sp. SPR117]|uniref:glucokinase n=1 Tax=Rhizorhapis sp. SPR117 TaxID=2912611 RepID=UPI001F005837|nr:glucokinase [Rhizorhapis sp. SPR117]
MKEIIVVDVGGTNARFARATVNGSGVPMLGKVRKYKVADYTSLTETWAAFARDDAADGGSGGALPAAAVIAFAAPIGRDVIKLTNSNWVIRPAALAGELGLQHLRLINDFEAVAYAVSKLPADNLQLLFGEDKPFPENGAVTILGPGTGLGVAMIVFDQGTPHVVATEGGHLDFAPLDIVETRLLDGLRRKYRRVSVERIVSGPGLNNIYESLAVINREKVELMDDADLWAAALDGTIALAKTALDRLCLSYGSVAGDLALAHGPHAVVLAGGLTQRMRDHLLGSGFHARFTAKGRYESLMASIPIRLAVHNEIGLYGAAAAYREKNA